MEYWVEKIIWKGIFSSYSFGIQDNWSEIGALKFLKVCHVSYTQVCGHDCNTPYSLVALHCVVRMVLSSWPVAVYRLLQDFFLLEWRLIDCKVTGEDYGGILQQFHCGRLPPGPLSSPPLPSASQWGTGVLCSVSHLDYETAFLGCHPFT